jgi:PST family polysaccharide transporter
VSVAELHAEQAIAPSGGTPAEGMAGRVAGNSLWLIFPPLLLQVLSVLSNAYIARKLGAVDYGQFSLGFAQVALFSPVCNLGLRAVAVRAIAQDRAHAREIAAAVLALRLLFTALATLLSLAWLCTPTYSLTTRLIGLAAVASMIFASLGVVPVDLFQGHERPRLAARPQILGGLSLTLLSVLALAAGLGLPGFVAAYVLGAAIQATLLIRTACREFFPLLPRWDWPAIKGLLRQLRPFALLSLMSSVTDAPLLDVLVLGAIYGPSSVGPYSAAIGLIARLLMIPQGVADAAYPAVAFEDRRGREAVEPAIRRCVTLLLVVTAPLALCLTLAAPTVLWLLYGSQYLSAAPALQVAAWLLPLTGLSYLIRECLSAVHRQGSVVVLNVLSVVVLGALCWLLIPRFGPLGAALAGVGRELVMLTFWLAALAREFRRPVAWPDLARLALALAALSLPFALATLAPGHLTTVAASAACFVAYAVAALKLGLVEPSVAARLSARLSRR